MTRKIGGPKLDSLLRFSSPRSCMLMAPQLPENDLKGIRKQKITRKMVRKTTQKGEMRRISPRLGATRSAPIRTTRKMTRKSDPENESDERHGK